MGKSETAGVERELLNMTKRRRLSYFGHVMQKEEHCLDKEIMQDTVSGAVKQRRRRMRWIDNMEKWTEMSFDKLLRETGESGPGVDLSMKRPTLGARIVKDKTRHATNQLLQVLVGKMRWRGRRLCTSPSYAEAEKWKSLMSLPISVSHQQSRPSNVSFTFHFMRNTVLMYQTVLVASCQPHH